MAISNDLVKMKWYANGWMSKKIWKTNLFDFYFASYIYTSTVAHAKITVFFDKTCAWVFCPNKDFSNKDSYWTFADVKKNIPKEEYINFPYNFENECYIITDLQTRKVDMNLLKEIGIERDAADIEARLKDLAIFGEEFD